MGGGGGREYEQVCRCTHIGSMCVVCVYVCVCVCLFVCVSVYLCFCVKC